MGKNVNVAEYVPAKMGRPVKHPFSTMEIGDEFFRKGGRKMFNILSSLRAREYRKGNSKLFSITRIADKKGYRVYRHR